MSSRRVLTIILIAVVCLTPVALTPTAAQDSGGYSNEINRRINQWQKDQFLAPFTQGLPAATPSTSPPVSTTPPPGPAGTKLAYCFGVNRTDPAWYGSDNPLTGCENDARNMAALATQARFQTTTFLTTQATSNTLFNSLRDAAGRLQPNDILLLTYSGHGSTVEDQNGDEAPNTEDQTWCLYDRMVIDDELGEAWTWFREGVRIYVVADSCHSGTSIRVIGRARNPLSVRGSRSLGAMANPTGSVRVRTLTPDAQRAAAARQLPANRQRWRDVPGKDQTEPNIRASVLLFAACEDNELASESAGQGAFTNALLAIVDGGRFEGTYLDLRAKVTARIGDSNQHPKLFQVGAHSVDLATDRPFRQ
jgi:hypothetical protein